MRRITAVPLLSALLTAGLLTVPAPASAAPTCIDPAIRPVCGGRVVPEAFLTATQHQYDGGADNLRVTLEAIKGVAPKGFITIFSAGKSAGGRDLWVAKVTDPSVPAARKKQVAASLSVHGLEPAAREGGVRYLEDLARWASMDPGHKLYAGDTAFSVRDVLRRTELYLGFTNPDGWSRQDLDNDNNTAGGQAPRYNANGSDLNRDFPTLGWINREKVEGQSRSGQNHKRGPVLDQPESKAWYGLLQKMPNLATATDIHGELTSVNNAFSDIMWPAGQWSPHMQAKELQFAKDMIRTVERKFKDEGITLADLFGPTIGQRPANVATGYDVVGYDDSGFMGDSMTRLRGGRVVELDVENFLSHIAPNVLWAAPLEQVHIAAVRGNIEATLVAALKVDKVRAPLNLGRVAYVDDPVRVTSKDGVGFDLAPGEKAKPYDVSRLTYFRDLARDAGKRIPGLPSADVAANRGLSAYDSIVVADTELPRDTRGRKVSKAAYVKALDSFVRAGGQLVLTDAAVGLLDDLRVVAPSDLTFRRANAGHVDFVAGDHELKKGLYGAPSQTYYEVALGFPPLSQAPHHGVKNAAFRKAGGTVVGTVNSDDDDEADPTVDEVVLGELPRGKGRIVVFGAVLPQPIESLESVETPHPEGLAHYGVTIAGGTVLHNALSYRRDGVTGRAAATSRVAPAGPGPSALGAGSASLAATGLATTLPGVAALALMLSLAAVRRRALSAA